MRRLSCNGYSGNIACIIQIGGMTVTRNSAFIGKEKSIDQQHLVAALNAIRCFGELLRQAAVIAFTVRCKVIGGR
jgi:hypothetical protein